MQQQYAPDGRTLFGEFSVYLETVHRDARHRAGKEYCRGSVEGSSERARCAGMLRQAEYAWKAVSKAGSATAGSSSCLTSDRLNSSVGGFDFMCAP